MPSEEELAEFEAEADRWNEEEHRVLLLMAETESAEVTDETERLHRVALLETTKRRLRESKGRVAAILAQVGDA